MRYGEVLEYYLEYCGKTRAEVARNANVSRSLITDIINGRAKEPTLTRAKAIADALGVPLQEMVDKMYSIED